MTFEHIASGAQLALVEAQYDLAAELLRFVVPPTDSEDAFSALPAASGSGIRSHGASELGNTVAPQRVRRPQYLRRSADANCYPAFLLLYGLMCL